MNQWYRSNGGMLLISCCLALGIVWIKAQERFTNKPLYNVPITLENVDDNLVLPEPWIPPTTMVDIKGPHNTIDLISQTGFYVDWTELVLEESGTQARANLRDEMFRTNLVDPDDRMRVSIVESSIKPRRLVLHVLNWNVEEEKPELDTSDMAEGQINIPLYRVCKRVPIAVDLHGDQDDLFEMELEVDPPYILITGSLEAVDKVKSVSTERVDAHSISDAFYVPLINLEQAYNTRSVNSSINNVTVTVKRTRRN